MNFLGGFVKILNSISSQVYAFGAILVGIFLVCKGQDIGKEIVLGGFTLMNTTMHSNTNIEHADGIRATVQSGT